MSVTKHELANWAREYATVIANHRESNRKVIDIFAEMEETARRQKNPELTEALLAVAHEGNKGGVLPAMRERPDIFDGWFICVFQYGLLYQELEKVLFRFADRSNEMCIDYFGPTAGICYKPPSSDS